MADGYDRLIATSHHDECRAGCGACCIAPSISSAIPGMPQGKPAGIRCIQLDDNNLCRLFGDPRRPKVCHTFHFDRELCGQTRGEALHNIAYLEAGSTP
ncbi:YkgJ family cysteine cluster protein [Kushneria pakistanensis]|uniref:YkgJ family cysteine cluster protein n=1 Tax=Kushneria pakistanensis TaxID=1508770 RepID=UPI0016768405|nr:YkgJ family cysteine cluster protein [Kushneria pakistanensis]